MPFYAHSPENTIYKWSKSALNHSFQNNARTVRVYSSNIALEIYISLSILMTVFFELGMWFGESDDPLPFKDLSETWLKRKFLKVGLGSRQNGGEHSKSPILKSRNHRVQIPPHFCHIPHFEFILFSEHFPPI